MNMILIWIIVGVVLLIGEMMSPSFFLFWFALGAFFAAVIAIFTPNLYVQAISFIIVSIILLLSTKPLVKKFLASKTSIESNVNGLIGKKAKVIEKIDFQALTGKIKVGGEIWKAIPENESNVFEENSEVLITSIEGVKLIVKGIEKDATI